MSDQQSGAEDTAGKQRDLADVAGKLAPRNIAIAAVIGLTLLSGVVHGYLDGRWSNPVDLNAQGDRLGELPKQLGDWVFVESTPLDEGAANLLRCYGEEVRRYRNEKNGAEVNVAVLFGPRGPIAVHTPEVCYDSAGRQQVGGTRSETISTKTAEHRLWTVQFAENSQLAPSLDVWYAWSSGGPFEAAKYPRVWLTESLYKIQVAGPVGDDLRRPCRDFLESYLPHVENVMR